MQDCTLKHGLHKSVLGHICGLEDARSATWVELSARLPTYLSKAVTSIGPDAPQLSEEDRVRSVCKMGKTIIGEQRTAEECVPQ